VDVLVMSDPFDVDFPVEAKGLEKSFDGERVLAGLDLRVPRGRNFVVMGLSGSGKSVTLKILAGLMKPDAGTARVDGANMEAATAKDLTRVRAKMGFLFQGAALIKWLTALENVALPLVELGVDEAQAQDRARKRLDDVGLSAEADKFPDQLSGGQRKRVGFARATVHEPKVILYDEPTTGLDPITKRTIDELIVAGREEFGATGIIVSHDLRSAVRVADVIGLLYEGKMVVVETPEKFLKSDHEVVRKFVQDGAPVTGRYEVL
jgi:phospholipid/cholesterol/gamma-HCH transport system ATP-binding protein